ncbi:MAG: serine hydrolase domain-containing protein [Cyanobacteriota bacterium]|nr:serine hydrolase domain-containing protein [Cyanobacteriota bacterium]
MAIDYNLLDDFEKKFEEEREYYQVPGAALAIVEGSDLIKVAGYGVRNLETGEPVTPETVFPIGSISKSMTSIMNATQVEAGIFDWDTLVKDISPQFKFADRQTTDNLQVRHVIGMRSGIGDPIGPYDGANNKYWDRHSAAYSIASLPAAPFRAIPGEKFHYGNESYASSGYFSPLMRGLETSQLLQEYKNLMGQKLFEPIGMTKTSITPIPSSISSDYASSYGLNATNGQGSLMEKAPINISNVNGMAPGGQVVSNAMDLSLYARMLLNKGVAINGNQIITPASLEKTWNDTIDAPGFPGLTNKTKYGLGWEIQFVELTTDNRIIEAIAHGGLLPAWVTWLMVVPDKNVGLIILTNSWSGFYFMLEMAKEFIKSLYGSDLDESQFIDYRKEYQEYVEELPKQIEEKVSSYTVKREEVESLLGNYEGGWNLEVNESDRLVLFKSGWVNYLFPSKAGDDKYIIGASNDYIYLRKELHDVSFSIDPTTSKMTMYSKMGNVAKLDISRKASWTVEAQFPIRYL